MTRAHLYRERSRTPNRDTTPVPLSPGHACRRRCDARTCICPPCACAKCRRRTELTQRNHERHQRDASDGAEHPNDASDERRPGIDYDLLRNDVEGYEEASPEDEAVFERLIGEGDR